MVTLIASWGNGGAGKTTVSLALANAISKYKQNVIVIGTDMTTPCLPLYLPRKDFTSQNSLGRLLNRNINSPNGLTGFIQLHPHNDYLGFIGAVSGENATTYNVIEHEQVINLIRILDLSTFDYIIFDCSTEPSADSTTMSALRLSDYVIRTISPDIRGMEFEKSTKNMMKNLDGLPYEDHFRIINNTFPYSPVDEIISVTGKVDVVLPNSKGVFNKQVSGQLVEKTGDKTGIQFEKQINLIAERIVENNG